MSFGEQELPAEVWAYDVKLERFGNFSEIPPFIVTGLSSGDLGLDDAELADKIAARVLDEFRELKPGSVGIVPGEVSGRGLLKIDGQDAYAIQAD